MGRMSPMTIISFSMILMSVSMYYLVRLSVSVRHLKGVYSMSMGLMDYLPICL